MPIEKVEFFLFFIFAKNDKFTCQLPERILERSKTIAFNTKIETTSLFNLDSKDENFSEVFLRFLFFFFFFFFFLK